MINKLLQSRRHRFILPELFPGAVLDIGCRDGKFIGKFQHGTGIDREGTAGNELNYPDGAFDLITMFAVVEHIPRGDMAELQSEIHRILKPTGRLFITTPARASHPILKLLAWMHIIPRKDIDEHVSYYSLRNILRTFDKFNLARYRRFDLLNQYFVLCKREY